MKSKVIDINEYKPHKVSVVVCLKCLNRFVSVRPVGVLLKQIECKNCGAGYVIETGEDINNL